ncbi:hypothetical protein BJX99DRAFT_270608 [Aspergillus californicus]
MGVQQSPNPLRVRRIGYKAPWVLLTFLYILWRYLPEPPGTVNDTHADKPAPEYDVTSTPRFRYQSRFREDPDYEFETTIDEVLRWIEDQARMSPPEYDAEKTIWQISLDPSGHVRERGADSLAFERVNEGWEYNIISSTTAQSFLENTFSDIPSLLTTYTSYPRDVLRADLLRYLLLWYHGGFYADLDVYPARSIKACPATEPLFHHNHHHHHQHKHQPQPQNISLILGIEIDEPYASPALMRKWHWSRSYGFIQYTMYAPRRFSPILRRAIVRVLEHTKQHVENSWGVFGTGYSEEDILEISGPGAFTDAVLDVLGEGLPRGHELVRVSRAEEDGGFADSGVRVDDWGVWNEVSWAPFHRLGEPLWVDASKVEGDMGGLGVLPVTVWGNGQRHSGAGHFWDAQACVNHRFGRTWKKGWWEFLFG